MKKKFALVTLISLVTIIFSPQPVVLAQTCPSIGAGTSRIQLENGFLTVRDTQSQASTKFQTSDKCIIGAPASVPQFSIPTYPEMKSLYITQNKLVTPISLSGSQTFTNSQPHFSKNTAYLYTINQTDTDAGNLTVDQNFKIPKGATVVVFVDGDLTINDDLNDEKDSGVIFVVQKEARIAPSVTSVNAFIITHGGFCSSFASGLCISSVGKLTLNGSIISFSSDPAKQPQFKRTNGLNIDPSEEIIYQPKYLVLLKNIFAKTLQLWSEIQ